MPSENKAAGLDLLLSNLTQQLRAAVLEGIQAGLDAGLKTAAPASRAARCPVAGCTRAVAARGLCQTHYSKARRIGFDQEPLNADQLDTLGRDGRKARFSGQAR
jgi:hypothetical protein